MSGEQTQNVRSISRCRGRSRIRSQRQILTSAQDAKGFGPTASLGHISL